MHPSTQPSNSFKKRGQDHTIILAIFISDLQQPSKFHKYASQPSA
jgi:hypothetical protein